MKAQICQANEESKINIIFFNILILHHFKCTNWELLQSEIDIKRFSYSYLSPCAEFVLASLILFLKCILNQTAILSVYFALNVYLCINSCHTILNNFMPRSDTRKTLLLLNLKIVLADLNATVAVAFLHVFRAAQMHPLQVNCPPAWWVLSQHRRLHL